MEQKNLEQKPTLILLDMGFKVVENGNESEVFEYSSVDSLRISKRINWFVTALSIITEYFLHSSGNVYKERDVLRFKYRNNPQRFSLKGCDMKLAQESTELINAKIRQAT